jgi:hypothetical protein
MKPINNGEKKCYAPKEHWFISSTMKVQSAENDNTRQEIISWRIATKNYFETKEQAVKVLNDFLNSLKDAVISYSKSAENYKNQILEIL